MIRSNDFEGAWFSSPRRDRLGAYPEIGLAAARSRGRAVRKVRAFFTRASESIWRYGLALVLAAPPFVPSKRAARFDPNASGRASVNALKSGGIWRPRPESNRGRRICSPLRDHSATRPCRSIEARRAVAYSKRDAPPARNGSQKPSTNGILPCTRARLALCKGGASLLYAADTTVPDSSAVEQSTVNRLVAGSNPAQGAKTLLAAVRSRPFRPKKRN
jgi:hypothetical protein